MSFAENTRSAYIVMFTRRQNWWIMLTVSANSKDLNSLDELQSKQNHLITSCPVKVRTSLLIVFAVCLKTLTIHRVTWTQTYKMICFSSWLMIIWCCTSFSTFKAYRDDGTVIMRLCAMKNRKSWAEFRLRTPDTLPQDLVIRSVARTTHGHFKQHE